MLTKPPLVPSNDALRVLRQLAFAGSTLAAIGVVTVNYDVYRRIRLAEQLLETKKQIRALSNGKGGAHMARVIEAAENGQDFSNRAMREQRIRERRFKPSISASSGHQGAREQEPMSPSTPHIEEGSHYSKERTAQRIRKATVTMTSTAPTHVYGLPRRYTKPTRHWPEVESRERETVKAPAPPAKKDTLYGKEAAEKIKRATIAMISTAPAHIYARAQKAVPKARSNLHASVASWLGTASESKAKTHATPTLIESLSPTTPDEMASKLSNMATSPSVETVEHVADEAVEYLRPTPIKLPARPGISIFEGNFSSPPSAQDHEKQHISEPNQDASGTRIGSEMSNSPNEKPHMTSPSHALPLLESIEAPQIVSRNPLTLDECKVEATITNVKFVLDETANGDLGRYTSSTLSAEHAPQNPVSDELATSVKSSGAEQALSSQETLSAESQDGDDARKNDHDSHNSSAIANGAPSASTIRGDDASFPRQPYHGIQLQQSLMTDEARPQNFLSWQHLQSLDESPSFEEQEDHRRPLDDKVTEEQQRSWREDADAETGKMNIEQQRVKHKWTPFPSSSPAPKRSTSLQNAEREFVSAHADPQIDSNYPENVAHASAGEIISTYTMTEDEKADLALRIRNAFSFDGLREGQRAWKAAAIWRIRHNDFATVDFLHAEFVEKGVMSMSPRHHIVQSLIQWHYGRSRYSGRAAEILFRDLRPGPTTSAESDRPRMKLSLYKADRLDSLFAIRFLQGLWDTSTDSDWLLLNFRRVIVAAKLRGVRLVEELFAAVIRFLASTGDMPTAQAVYDEMVFYHQIKASFLSQTLIVRGYARLCDWHRVEREIESLHHRGLARSRPHGYALMINAVLQEYAARASLEQFQNFLINAISYLGLVPTSSVSMTTVQAYLSQQRYDLVREWMETLQVLFPQIETETSSFQWLLGNSWVRAGSSCEDIEEAIKAVAYRNPRTKLKSFSLPTIHEALSRDLAAKLDAARAKTQPSGQASPSSSTEGNDFISTKTLDEYLSSAFSLAASTVSQNRPPTPEVIELHRQASAVQRLNTFLTGTSSSEAADKFSFPDPESDKTRKTNVSSNRGPVPTTASLSHLHDSIPKVFTAEFLPQTSIVTAAILDFYHTRSLHHLPTDHALLTWVCERLLHADRAFDAVVVIQSVYDDRLISQLAGLGEEGRHAVDGVCLPGPGAVGFGIQFYEFWMQLAWVTRSLVQWRRVMEEVLRLSRPGRRVSYRGDDGSEQTVLTGVRITSSFLFLTRSIASRGLKSHWSRWRYDHGRGPIEEVNCLVQQVQKRREGQTGRKEAGMWFEVKHHGYDHHNQQQTSDGG